MTISLDSQAIRHSMIKLISKNQNLTKQYIKFKNYSINYQLILSWMFRTLIYYHMEGYYSNVRF